MPTELRFIPAVCAAALVSGMAVPEVKAQGGFNPFWQEQFPTRQEAKQKTQVPDNAAPGPPYLPPMSDQPAWNGNRAPQGRTTAGTPAEAGVNAQRPQQGRPTYIQRGPIEGGQGRDQRWQPQLPQSPPDERSLGVDSTDLAPVMAGDGSNLPYELWRGLTVNEIGQLISSLEIPPRSPALHHLWQRLITSNVPAPGNNQDNTNFTALRAEALYRSGLLQDSETVLATVATEADDPLIAMLKSRTAIAVGRTEEGCALAKGLVRDIGKIPKTLAGDASLAIGYCATRDNNAAAAGLSAELAAENGLTSSPGLSALKAFSVGSKPRIEQAKRYGIVDYLILQQIGVPIDVRQLPSATPALLAFIASQPNAQAGDVRLAAGESALSVNVIDTDALSALYRSEARAGSGPASERARLFDLADTETMPLRKARHIRAFLDDARRNGFYWHALKLMAPASNAMALVPEIGWFAETGIETSLAAGDLANARKWAAFAGSQHRSGAANLEHWVALIELIDPNQGSGRLQQGLQIIEQMAVRGRLDPMLLHRLATVLDALNIQVPIPLWEAASRTPQPTSGHLPETGVLSRLQAAAKKKEFGRTVLLTMKTLGPNGTEGAHMIALGDSIRALKRAGLEEDARKLGLEALFGAWPRSVTN